MKNLISKNVLKNTLYVLLVVVFLQSCNKLEKGTVVNKHYEPERTYLQMMPIVISNGKTTTTMLIPYYITDNEDYVLHVKGYYKGEEIKEEVYVTKECYNSLQNGDLWLKTDDCSFSDINNDKRRK